MSRVDAGRTGLVLLVAVVTALWVAAACGDGDGGSKGDAEYPYAVQRFDDQGREHLAPDQTYGRYNSNPPTSGPHAPRAAPWGVSRSPLPKEVPVHNMEHGGVVIWYDCSGGPAPLDEADCQELADHLTAIVEEAVGQGKEVLMTPYPEMEQRIALTGWQHLDAFDEFDEARVRAFIDFFERRFNPEGF